MNDWFSDGATTEYCMTQPSSIAQKPTGLTHIQAASCSHWSTDCVAGAVRSREAPGALSSGSIGSALMFVLFINSSILQQEVHR